VEKLKFESTPTESRLLTPDMSSASSSSEGKKRKANDAGNGSSEKTLKSEEEYELYTLADIRSKIQGLCKRVPAVPENNFETADGKVNEGAVLEWAEQLQAVLEELNLLVCCVATATYKWGTERSGAGDQNLSLLSGELNFSQDQISSAVTPRLTNVLAPVVDLVIEKTVTSKDDQGREIKENHFTRKLVDPDFVSLCHTILARNAPLLRHVVMSNFVKLLRVIHDYLDAQKNDSQHSRGFAY
jgi:hypothetical protein